MAGSRVTGRVARVAATAVLAGLPLACAAPGPPPNPFVGTWATADNNVVTIREDTIVQTEPDGKQMALDRQACRGVFRFGYATRTRESLTDLVPRQPELRKKLSEMLAQPSYPVAVLDCDQGDQTYVLVNDRQLVAIYRDGDIGAVERLARR